MAAQSTKFIVSGIVQGVGFRYHTCHEGLKRGLTGYAKNLDNGDVEVVACGERGAIDSLAVWLKQGPRFSTVHQVTAEEVMFKAYNGFTILY